MSHNGYKSVRDYAVIGNLRTVAVIGRDGSVDWCCFPHMDSESVFGSILDCRKGGRFRVSLAGVEMGDQHYLPDTNVLVTRFKTSHGSLSVTDFMPLSGNIEKLNSSSAPTEIQRMLVFQGRGQIEVEWSPRFDYARSRVLIKKHENGWMAMGADGKRLSLAGLSEVDVVETEYGPKLVATLPFDNHGRRVIITRWDSDDTDSSLDQSIRMLKETSTLWSEWAHHDEVTHSTAWTGDMNDLVIRSGLVLKLLTHAETGAIAAAATTSLPETIGGIRNWDYRYAWIRDASLTGQTMTSLGHGSAAADLLDWMERVTTAKVGKEWDMQIMYTLHGHGDMEEKELQHLEGYRQSRPVRIGNEASEQFQLEIYGEVLTASYELARRGHQFDEPITELLSKIVSHVQSVWKEPDNGIWEIRGKPRHYTYSKVMAWVVFDRAIHLAEQYGFRGDVNGWKRTANEIRQAVLTHGYSEKAGSFTMAFDREDLDAVNLRIPLLEFLRCTDPRVQNTINRAMEQLTEDGLVYRYRIDDGLEGKEGAFGLCSFWLVDALAISGRVDEALEIFEKVVRWTNHVGLFSEQIDPATGEFLGNFPQAFTHIGLIDSVLYLAYAQGKPIPVAAPIGTPTHRQQMQR